MNKIHNKDLYKYKAEKYYQKYLNLKNILNNNQIGGTVDKPEWFDEYLRELDDIYQDGFIVTGSGAVSIYLNHFNNITNGKFNKLIPTLRTPNDVDFVYYCKGADYEKRRNFNKYKRLQTTEIKSATYNFDELVDIPTFIKSFDLTCLNKIYCVDVGKYKLLSLEKLLFFYSGDLEDDEMFLRNYQEEIIDLEKKISSENIHSKLSYLKEQYEELVVKLEKKQDKILALNLKINILNVLMESVKTNPTLSSVYNVIAIPAETSIFSRARVDSEEKKPSPSGTELIKKLFGIEDGTDEKLNPESTIKGSDFYAETEKFNETYDSNKSYSLDTPVQVSKKLDFGFDSDDEGDDESNDKEDTFSIMTPPISKKLDFGSPFSGSRMHVSHVPYNIKFDFENDDI